MISLFQTTKESKRIVIELIEKLKEENFLELRR